MKTVLWLDVDGVLLDYTTPFLKMNGIDANPHYLKTYDFKEIIGISSKDLEERMLRFSLSDEFKNLPALADRILLQQYFQAGVIIKAITKLPVPAQGKQNRLYNLVKRYGPIFNEIVFTDHGQCKVKYIKERYAQESNDVNYHIVEDSPEFIDAVDDNLYDALNIHAHAVRYKYNLKSITNSFLVHPWNDLNHFLEYMQYADIVAKENAAWQKKQ